LIKKYELPVSKVYYTQYRPKWLLLRKIHPEFHYDDSEKEIKGLNDHGIRAILVNT